MNSKLISVKDEAKDIKSFKFLKPKGFNFIPGQHCLITLNNESRPFTLISIPEDNYVEFMIKKVGRVTSKLFEIKEGQEIELGEPFGINFNYKENNNEMVFVSGGSGITPFLSVLRYVSEKNKSNKITLFYFNRTEEDIPYKKEFEDLNKFENININLILTSPSEEWEGKKGYFKKEYVENVNSKYYLCGPPQLVDSSIKILTESGVKEEDIKFENWSAPKEKKMDKNKLYKCEICGNIVQVVEGKPIPIICCGQEMGKMTEQNEEAEKQEKHVPIVTVEGNNVTVKVGSVEHPMEEEHYIQLIQVFQNNKLVGEKELRPDDKPEATFCIENVENITAKELCNLHGLWTN